MSAHVIATAISATHSFSKPQTASITLLKGLGIEGDAHCGEKVKHRSRVKQNPDQPNLRQVHLIHQELLDELNAQGFSLQSGSLGENITTSGIDILKLPTDTVLRIGKDAQIRITGLRNPCYQLDDFQQGLTEAVLDRTGDKLIRKSGVMATVAKGGIVNPGDPIEVILPAKPHTSLGVV